MTRGIFFVIFEDMIQKILAQAPTDIIVPTATLGFKPPNLQDIITFFIRFLFVVAGLTALIYLVLGAFAWITSGGNKENIDKAREKIQAAVVGLILILVVLGIVMLLEQIVFPSNCGLGIGRPVCVPKLVK